MACVRRVALIVNCGYARVCIYQNYDHQRTGTSSRQTIDIAKRQTDFKEQFSGTYCFPAEYFDVKSKNMTQFDRDCNKILDGFTKKFPPQCNRESYLNTFSKSKWCALPVTERSQHSLSNCVRCYELHKDRQQYFPLKPTYQPAETVVTVKQGAMQRLGVKRFTNSVIAELNRVYEDEASTSFTDSLVRTKSSGLEKKKSKKGKRKERVRVQKELTKVVNEHFAESAAISMLTECESKLKYHRKRMAQSFHSPQEQPPAKKAKKHSPNFSNVNWDKQKLQETIENWPADTTINWSKIARENGIPGKNAGQVVKEFTAELGLDTSHIATPKRKPTVRPRMKKLPGSEVSIPSIPPTRVF